MRSGKSGAGCGRLPRVSPPPQAPARGLMIALLPLSGMSLLTDNFLCASALLSHILLEVQIPHMTPYCRVVLREQMFLERVETKAAVCGSLPVIWTHLRLRLDSSFLVSASPAPLLFVTFLGSST